jgi:hypothetical protein
LPAQLTDNKKFVFDMAIQSGGAVFSVIAGDPVFQNTLHAGATLDRLKILDYTEPLTVWYAKQQTGFRLLLPSVSKRAMVNVKLAPKLAHLVLAYPNELLPCGTLNR